MFSPFHNSGCFYDVNSLRSNNICILNDWFWILWNQNYLSLNSYTFLLSQLKKFPIPFFTRAKPTMTASYVISVSVFNCQKLIAIGKEYLITDKLQLLGFFGNDVNKSAAIWERLFSLNCSCKCSVIQ